MNPLVDDPPTEIPLPDAPLIRVVAQVRFPLIASIADLKFIGPFQEAIRKRYPLLQQQQSQTLTVHGGGVHTAAGPTIWRFHDKKSAWSVVLAPTFLALDTTAYESRKDFIERFSTVLEALQTHIDPQVVERLGLRYIDQLQGNVIEQLHTLVRPEVSGVLASPLRACATAAVTEQLFELPHEQAKATVRWGLLPPGSTLDPNTTPPVEEPTWNLDIDAYRTGQQELDHGELAEQAQALAARVYSLFRWVVEDSFLTRFGGKL